MPSKNHEIRSEQYNEEGLTGINCYIESPWHKFAELLWYVFLFTEINNLETSRTCHLEACSNLVYANHTTGSLKFCPACDALTDGSKALTNG